MRLFSFAGSRPAMIRLALAPPTTTDLRLGLRCATPITPIATGRTVSSCLRTLPATDRQRRNPLASDARPHHTSRGFLSWRFADAGPRCAPRHLHRAGIRKPSQQRSFPGIPFSTHSRLSTIEVPVHLRSPGVLVPVQASAERRPMPRRPCRAAASRRSRTQGQEDAAAPLPTLEFASPR